MLQNLCPRVGCPKKTALSNKVEPRSFSWSDAQSWFRKDVATWEPKINGDLEIPDEWLARNTGTLSDSSGIPKNTCVLA